MEDGDTHADSSTGENKSSVGTPVRRGVAPLSSAASDSPSRARQLGNNLLAIALALGAVWLTLPLASHVPESLFIPAFAAVTLAAWLGGVGPGLVAAIVCVLGIDYYIIPPKYQFRPTDPADLISLSAFIAVAALVGTLTENLRRARDLAASAAVAADREASRARQQAALLEQANRQLQDQELELELVNQTLQEQTEELEASNEELQSTTEELMQGAEELAGARAIAEEERKRLAAVLDSLPDAAAVFDSDWRYVYLNPAGRALHVELLGRVGIPAHEAQHAAMGRIAWEVFPWLVGTKFETESLRAVAEWHTVEYVELVPSLGRWYETRIVPTATGAVSLNRDVTAQYAVQAERERLLAAERAAREAAEAANQAKSEFLATMSHELRTPLNAIQGYTQLLDMELHGPVTGSQRDALRRIDRAQRHLLGIINDILNFARLEGGNVEYHVEPLDLRALPREVAPLIEPQMEMRGVSFEIDDAVKSSGAALLAWADREKLTQILLNLLSNAAKFTQRGGRVVVTVGEVSDETVHLEVRDTGVGIPADKLEAVFQPFVQIRAANRSRGAVHNSEGVGLGLAISRDLARGMGGDLRATSIEGVGSAFTVILRRASVQNAEASERRAEGVENRTAS